MGLDHWVANLLAPLGFWVLLNALDDLVIDFAAAWAWLRYRPPSDTELDRPPPARMAIFVALWQEHRVIQRMLDTNVPRLRYPAVDFFIGVYPNDAPTIAAVRAAMERYPNVHLAMCPHDGPTSKADCLNWIYQRMLLHEEENHVRFEMVLTHDAEDTIHPESLRHINYYRAQGAGMVQIPVLALPTPVSELTHGIYCDEFTEYEYKDMMAREVMGGFIPSNGVGTGFSRAALDALAVRHHNRVFETAALTEDYENGLRVHALGFSQKFVPITLQRGTPVATREYFPRSAVRAVRQRSRWITGNTLQTWEFHGLEETLRYAYWLWRDRKGLIGNLATPLTNILFVYGLLTLAWARAHGAEWGLARETASLASVYLSGLGLQAVHTAIRMLCVSRIYGYRFAALVPVRVVWGNWINATATAMAIFTYARARALGRPLRWIKTDHAWPNREALMQDRKRLGEILVGGGWLTQQQLDTARATRPAGQRLGQHLIALGLIDESDLYTALSLQTSLPLGKPEPAEVSVAVTRSLPASLAREWRVLPFRVAAGELYVASSEVPTGELHDSLRRFSSLELRFRLVTTTEFDELAAQFLPTP